MISALIVSLALARIPEMSKPAPEPSLSSLSPEAAARLLARLDDSDRRLKALEQRQRDLRGWWLDTAIVIAGTSVDTYSTGDFRDHPERGLVESNDLVGNGSGAAEKHIALKAVGVAVMAIASHELRAHGHPKEARIVSLVFGTGFTALGVRNWAMGR